MNFTEERERELSEIRLAKVKEYMPVILLLSLLVISGIPGNIFILLFYKQKKQRRVGNAVAKYIRALAVVDMTQCCVSIPIVLSDLVRPYQNSSDALCKFQKFFNFLTAAMSLLVALAVVVERYKVMCKKHIDKYPNNTLAIFFSVSLILSLPNIFLIEAEVYKLVVVTNVTVIGYECTGTADNKILSVISYVQQALYIIIFIVIIVSVVALYTRIIRAVMEQRAVTKSSMGIPRTELFSQEITLRGGEENDVYVEWDKVRVNSGVSEVSVTNEAEEISTREISSFDMTERKKHHHSKPGLKRRQSNVGNRGKHSAQISMIMMAISSLLCLSYIPYFCSAIHLAVSKDKESEMTWWFQLLNYSFLLSCGVNHFIYGLFDFRFRRFVKQSISCR